MDDREVAMVFGRVLIPGNVPVAIAEKLLAERADMRHQRVVVTHYGGPEVITVIEDDISTPKAGEVRVKSAGVRITIY
jgi:hypothetical protein